MIVKKLIEFVTILIENFDLLEKFVINTRKFEPKVLFMQLLLPLGTFAN